MGIEELCPSCRRLQVCLDCVEPALSVNKIGMRLLASLHLHLTRPVCIQWEHFGHALELTKPSFGWILPLGRPPLNQLKVRLNSPGVSQKFTSNSYFRRQGAFTNVLSTISTFTIYGWFMMRKHINMNLLTLDQCAAINMNSLTLNHRVAISMNSLTLNQRAAISINSLTLNHRAAISINSLTLN